LLPVYGLAITSQLRNAHFFKTPHSRTGHLLATTHSVQGTAASAGISSYWLHVYLNSLLTEEGGRREEGGGRRAERGGGRGEAPAANMRGVLPRLVLASTGALCCNTCNTRC
jgi:hypothetical protein